MPALAEQLHRKLQAHGDPVVAAGQFAYMKEIQPFRGVKAPLRRRLLRDALAEYPLRDESDFEGNVLELWRGKYREERLLALDLSARSKQFRDEARPLFERLLAEADWWDVLDPLASDLLGGALRKYPELLAKKIRVWRKSPHLWTRRAALLVQLKYRQQTDHDLLAETILMLADEKDFFIRKAIGWILREYAKTSPDWVNRFVRGNEQILSALSRREALRRMSADNNKRS